MEMKQCGLCGEHLPCTAFDGRAKDCTTCRYIEAQRPSRGGAPIEKALTPRGAKAAILAEARLRSKAEGVRYEVDHVIPMRGKVRRQSDDWVLVCGLDVPSNWAIVPKSENRGKWMFLSRADARSEEERLMREQGGSPDNLEKGTGPAA